MEKKEITNKKVTFATALLIRAKTRRPAIEQINEYSIWKELKVRKMTENQANRPSS